jgi:hypothetical protein
MKENTKIFILELQNYMENKKTNQTTIRVIMYYISRWIENKPTEQLSIIAPEASLALKAAVHSQTKIGWNNFIKGRMSKKWCTLYNDDKQYTILGDPKLPTSDIWARDIINITWNYVLNTWYCRNNVEHQKDLNNVSTVKERLIAKIEWIHE